jgi:hypothetical protein
MKSVAKKKTSQGALEQYSPAPQHTHQTAEHTHEKTLALLLNTTHQGQRRVFGRQERKSLSTRL